MSRTAGAKTQTVRQILSDHPQESPKEISEMLKEQGVDATADYVSRIKFKMKGKGRKKARAAAAPTPEAAATPAVPKDAISIGLLQKAKKLAKELGGIKEAKAAIDALAQILD
jgi:hypothetical protein